MREELIELRAKKVVAYHNKIEKSQFSKWKIIIDEVIPNMKMTSLKFLKNCEALIVPKASILLFEDCKL